MVSSIYLIFIIKWIILAMKPSQTRGNPVSVRTDQASGPHPVSNIFHTDFFTRIRFPYTNAFSHKDFSRTEAFIHRYFHIQKLLQNRDGVRETTIVPNCKLLYTEAFTYQGLYKQNLLPKEGFSCKYFTQNNFTQSFFPYKPFYIQNPFYTDTSTYGPFYTQSLLHTDTFIEILLYRNIDTIRSFLQPKTFIYRNRD